MDIFEGSEAYPARTAEQDEEEQAASVAPLSPPLILWNRSLRQRLYPDGIMPECMIVATSKVSCAMLNGAFEGKQVIGSCVLPETVMRGNYASPSLRDRTCTLYACGERGQLLLVCCQYDIPSDRAVAVTRAIFRETCPKHTLILGAVPSDQLRAGDTDPSQEPLVFLLASSSTSRAPGQSSPVPFLPSGSLVPGLPAACLSYCQARAMSAELVVTVDMVPSLLHMGLGPMARAAGALCARQPGGDSFARLFGGSGALKTACAAVEATYGGSLNGVGAVFA